MQQKLVDSDFWAESRHVEIRTSIIKAGSLFNPGQQAYIFWSNPDNKHILVKSPTNPLRVAWWLGVWRMVEE